MNSNELKSKKCERLNAVILLKQSVPAVRSECFERTGKPPIGVRWVDVNKGDDMNVEFGMPILRATRRRIAKLDC